MFFRRFLIFVKALLKKHGTKMKRCPLNFMSVVTENKFINYLKKR
jgi:hypothetical protein